MIVGKAMDVYHRPRIVPPQVQRTTPTGPVRSPDDELGYGLTMLAEPSSLISMKTSSKTSLE